MKHRLPLVVAVALLAVAIPASTASAKTTITMSGSTSVAPLAAKLAKGYLKAHPGAPFKLAQGGSDIGIADVAAGRVTIGNSSRDPKPTDPGGLVFNKIARDAICLVDQPGNPLGSLSQAQVQAIFSGRSATGARCPARQRAGTIDLFVRTARLRHPGRVPEDLHGQRARSRRAPARRPRTASCSRRSSRDQNAIGYVSLAFTKGLNDAAYKGVACTLRNAKSGQYGGVAQLLDGHPRRGRRARAEVHQLDPAEHGGARKIIATDWVPLALDERHRSHASPRRPLERPARRAMLGALACRRARC